MIENLTAETQKLTSFTPRLLSKLYRLVVLITILLPSYPALMAQGASSPPALFVENSSMIAGSLRVNEKDPVEVLRSRGIGLEKSAVRALAQEGAEPGTATVQLNLFADTQFPMRIERREPTHDGVGLIVHGWVGNSAEDRVILTVYEGALSGSVRMANGESYDMFVDPSGSGEIRQVRFQGNPDGADDYVIPDEDENGLVRFAKASRIQVPKEFQPSTDMANRSGVVQTVDLLMAYTVRTRDARGGTAGVLAHINTIVAESNAAFANSNALVQLRLVHAVQVNYDDSLGNMSYNTALSALRQTSDNVMDEVHALRNEYGADLVALLVSHPFSGGTVGMAYMCTSSPSNFAPWAFSVTHQGYAGGVYLSFAHEVGHNLGLNHDADNGGSNGALHSYS
nr:zinc-dependent metalloprotease [Bryobacterales bacterium]